MATAFRILVEVLGLVLLITSILGSLIVYEIASDYFIPQISEVISVAALLAGVYFSYLITSVVAACLRDVLDKQLKKGIRV